MKHFELASGQTNQKVLEAAEELAKQGYYPVGGIFFDRSARVPYSMVMFRPLQERYVYNDQEDGSTVATKETIIQDAPPATQQAPAIQDAPPATQQPYSDKSPKATPADPTGKKGPKENVEVGNDKATTSTKTGK